MKIHHILKVFFIIIVFCVTLYVLYKCSFNVNETQAKLINPVISGQQIANYLNSDYANTIENCGSNSRPAFLCSGIMLRATNPDTDYNAWDPSPSSVSSGGVSFSFLRKDSKFNKLAYGYLNGFIFYPYSYAPASKNTNIDVECMFPVDADSLSRAGNGCGAHINFPLTSGPCQALGIMTADQWITHYNSSGGNKRQHQCGFEVSENSEYNGTEAFYQAITSTSKIADESIGVQNELRLATWDTNTTGYPGSLPIEAFFYIYKQKIAYTPIEKGLVAAQHDQGKYYQMTGVWVPVIRLSLPLTLSEEANFNYSEDDQSIQEPVS